jgi:phage FluMu gp28-like protein
MSERISVDYIPSTRWKKKYSSIESRIRAHINQVKPVPPPTDVVQFCREWLNYEPYSYMWPFLNDESRFIAVLQARQTGKTFNGMAKLLHIVLTHPGSTAIITAPKYDQIKRIAFKHLHAHLNRMRNKNLELFNSVVDDRGLMKTIIRLRNGSQIIAEPSVPETIRGHTAKVVYLMEMNFIRDDEDLYTAVLFTLNTTDGFLIAESTPWNTDSVFYRIFHDPSYTQFSTHTVPYNMALTPNGPLSPRTVGHIREQLKGDPNRWKREMLCQWTEETDRWLPTSLIALCQDANLKYYKPHHEHSGVYYAGVDFGKLQDHSVVAVVEQENRELHLRHCNQFKLDTPYGVVIGYLKRLQDNWSNIIHTICDRTGVGEYIVEDMRKSGIRNIEGMIFTETNKETLATALKETMRTVECPTCLWKGHIETINEEWTTTCPEGCTTNEGNPQPLTPRLRIPYDPNIYIELNTPTYELSKIGKIHYSHQEGSKDDRFWAIAMAVYASTQRQWSRPIAKA